MHRVVRVFSLRALTPWPPQCLRDRAVTARPPVPTALWNRTDSISLSGSVTVRHYLLSVVSSTSSTEIAVPAEPLAEGQAADATTPLAARDWVMKRSRLGCLVFRALSYVRRKNSQCCQGGRTLMRLALPSFAKPLVAKRTFSLCFWPGPAAPGSLQLPLAARLPGADPGAVYVAAIAAAADERLRSASGA